MVFWNLWGASWLVWIPARGDLSPQEHLMLAELGVGEAGLPANMPPAHLSMVHDTALDAEVS